MRGKQHSEINARNEKVQCPHCPPCGGCAFIDRPLSEALEAKTGIVAEALRRFSSLDGALLHPCVAAPRPTSYRTRIKLACQVQDKRLRIGLFRPGTHDVVDVPECRVAHAALLPILDAIRASSKAIALPLGHVDLRWSCCEQRAHLTLVASAKAPAEDWRDLAATLIEARPELKGVSLRAAFVAKTPRVLSGETTPLLGEEALVEQLAGSRFHLSPGSFFQVDPAAAEALHDVARAWLAPPGSAKALHLLDVYAGVGAFAISLADIAKRVTAVESVAAAAADARKSAALSGVELLVIAAPAETLAGQLLAIPADLLVVDPPRRGVDPHVLQAIGRIAPERMVYVSCDPQTAARDLDALAAFGLVTRAAQPVDMFSLTREVEVAFLIERAAQAFEPRILHRANDVIAALKPAILPTRSQIEGEQSLEDAVREKTGLADLQPAHSLDVGTSGPVLFARGETLGELARAFGEQRVKREYLALVRGIPRKRGAISLKRGRHAAADERSRYRLEDVVGGYGLVRVLPETDFKDQVHRHLARIGHPILGDERYGDRRANRFLAETCALGRPFLHLERIAFVAPSGQTVVVESPLAAELQLVLDRLVALRRNRAAQPSGLDP